MHLREMQEIDMRRIIIADDVELNRELLRGVLEDTYLVEMAEDGEEALAKLAEFHQETAVVLLDLKMPNMDGYTVLEEMRGRGWTEKIPVLVISGEDAAEAENRCLELGVADFVHKPFDGSIVKNRIKNAVDLFAGRNQLAQKVEEQAKALKERDRIIQLQAEKLREGRAFVKLMMEYRSAMLEVETRLKVLNDEFSIEYNRNPFESIKSRLKSPESIYEKLERKGFPISVESIEENLTDVAGLRVICSFPDDIYRLADLCTRQDDISLIRKKDYIKYPKCNGYRSLHLILSVPIFLSDRKKYVKVEVQFRTIAMDFWASLEHKLKYKKDVDEADGIILQLKACADSIEELDYQMQEIRDRIDKSRG